MASICVTALGTIIMSHIIFLYHTYKEIENSMTCTDRDQA